jgi:hypothetical protein
MESASISHFAKQHPHVRLINTTEEGIGFEQIDYIPFHEAVRGFEAQDLRKRVIFAIAQNPMPKNTSAILSEKRKELQNSLDRLIGCLEILVLERQGSAALAEIDLKEEIAFACLFYDIFEVIKSGPGFWQDWLALARKYAKVLCQRVSTK